MLLQKWLLLFAAIAAVAPAFAGSGISAPRLGAVRLSDGSVRNLYGFSSNFILGEVIAAEAKACAFSNEFGLILSQGKLRLLAADGRELGTYETNEQEALLSVGDSETSALAYLVSSGVLLKWDGKQFTEFPVSLAGRIVSMDSDSTELNPLANARGSARSTACTEPRPSGSGCDEIRLARAYLFFRSTDARVYRATVLTATGDVLSTEPLPGSPGPTAALGANVLFYDKQLLHIRLTNSVIQSLGIREPDLTFEKIAEDWLHIVSKQTSRHWALRIIANSVELSELPLVPAPAGAKQ